MLGFPSTKGFHYKGAGVLAGTKAERRSLSLRLEPASFIIPLSSSDGPALSLSGDGHRTVIWRCGTVKK